MMLTTLLMSILISMEPNQPEKLDLAGWVSIALENSPAVRSAEASLLSAEASLTGTRSFLYPSLSASAGASKTWADSYSESTGVTGTESNSYSAGLTLSQELLHSGGQNWLYEDASQLSLNAAQADYQGAILDVTIDVANAYYDVFEALELMRAASDAYSRSSNQLQRTEALYAMGAVTTLELLQVQVQESSDKLAVSRTEQSLLTAYADLYRTSGSDVQTCLIEINPDAVLEPVSPESVERMELDYSENPDIKAALFRERAAEIRSRAAGRSYWPSLRASAGWNWNDNTLDGLDHMFDNDSYNAGLSLSWNIFDGFQRESSINSSRASFLSSRATRETLENSVEAGVRSLAGSLLIDIQYYRDSMLMVEQAGEQYRLSQMSYEMGALTLLDLLDAQADLSQAEANLVSARVTALRTEASLMAQLGRMPRVGE